MTYNERQQLRSHIAHYFDIDHRSFKEFELNKLINMINNRDQLNGRRKSIYLYSADAELRKEYVIRIVNDRFMIEETLYSHRIGSEDYNMKSTFHADARDILEICRRVFRL